jgi:signal transduction histidine kinase
MDKKHPHNDVSQLLRIMAGLWLGYWLVLFVLDSIFYPHPLYPVAYYVVNEFTALVLLIIARGHKLRAHRDPIFLPLVIGLMSALPLIVNHLMGRHLPPGPQTRLEFSTLRLMPVLLMPLVLTAWQYRWRHVVLFSVSIALLTLGLHGLVAPAHNISLLPPLTMATIQLISFLIVGYFISELMRRLREQQRSLEAAHRRVVRYASTLEHLTISRERNRLARELHDTLAHTLSALSVQLETVKAYWDVEPLTAQELLDQALTATRSGLQETRRALTSLRASPLDDLGLLLALRQVAEETADRANARLDLTLPASLPALTPDVEQCLYRVAQEALANAAHHAHARTLALHLAIEGDLLTLRVRDDGVGFDTGAEQAAGHFGLSGMRERTRLVGGNLEVESASEQGTTVQLVVHL